MPPGSDNPQSFQELDPRAIAARITDTDDYSGGGTVAALTAASAAAVATLVLRLSARRKSNAHASDEIRRATDRVTELADAFYAAADDDSRVFRTLMETRREARRSGDWDDYHQALQDAALSPVHLSEHIVELLAIIDEQVQYASRFTVSDLGAAATLAHGALQGALLTAEVNISLLRSAETGSRIDPEELDQQRRNLEEDARRLTSSIIQRTRQALHPEPEHRKANQEPL